MFFLFSMFLICLKLLQPYYSPKQLCATVYNHHYNCYNASYLCWPNSTASAWHGVAARIDTKGHSESSVGLTTVWQQQPQSRYLLRHMPTMPWVLLRWVFSLRVELSTDSLYLVSVMVFLFVFRCLHGCHVHLWGFSHWTLHHCRSFMCTLGRHMYLLMMARGPCQECTEWLLIPLFWVGGFMLLIQLSPAIQSIWWEYSFGGWTESPILTAFPTWQGRVFFSRLCSPWFHGWLQICDGC